jgi:hypothetical protein
MIFFILLKNALSAVSYPLSSGSPDRFPVGISGAARNDKKNKKYFISTLIL